MPRDFVNEDLDVAEVSAPFEPVRAFTPASDADEVLRVLAKARDLLSDPRRWAKGDYCVGDAFCALGAIRHVQGVRTDCTLATGFLSDFLGGHVNGFNDKPSTSHADVLALFDLAISARRAELAS